MMQRMVLRILAMLLTVGGLIFVWRAAAQGQGEPDPSALARKEEQPTPLYFGASLCVECHKEPRDRNLGYLCRCSEYTIWDKEDKHRDAYIVLQGERARRMGAILKWDNVAERKECLACHSVVIPDDRFRHRSFERTEGITCAICHGAYKDWVGPHYNPLDRDAWRLLPRTAKEAKYGMADLWDPVKRAKLCTSCHVGNAAEGQFVTHAMYAAGHPPLPGFEPAIFSDRMRHWQYLREKDAAIQTILQYQGREREQTKLLLVGTAVSLAESMGLLAEQGHGCAKATAAEQRGLDLANFDCYACHHDLKTESWRQKYGFAGKPGRVPMRPWPTVLVRLAIQQAAGNPTQARQMMAELDKHLHQVRDGFDARPFGSPNRIAPAAAALAAWARNLAEQVNRQPCDEAAARRLLAQIPSLFMNSVADYDSARQIAWALQVICAEQGNQDAEVKRLLDSLKKQLKLDLPAGRARSIEKELPQGLRIVNDYDPAMFQNALQQLASCLEKK